MANATHMQELTAQIECLVCDQVAEIQRAVEQALSSATVKGTVPARSLDGGR
jgi:hypothetical protein